MGRRNNMANDAQPAESSSMIKTDLCSLITGSTSEAVQKILESNARIVSAAQLEELQRLEDEHDGPDLLQVLYTLVDAQAGMLSDLRAKHDKVWVKAGLLAEEVEEVVEELSRERVETER